MSYIRKFSLTLVLLLVGAMFLTQSGYAGSLNSQSFAQILHELGLYKGISDTTFDPDLSSTLDRQTGVIVLLRLFGQEQNALDMDNLEVEDALKNFNDKDTIATWSKKQIAYAVKNGYMAGFPDRSIRAFRTLTGKEYCSLILKRLNIPFQFHESGSVFTQTADVSNSLSSEFGTSTSILKDNLVAISYVALNAKNSEGKKVLQMLYEQNKIPAGKERIYVPIASNSTQTDPNAPLILVTSTPSPTPTPIVTPTPLPTPTPYTLAVQSVVVSNLHQINVIFNKPVLKDSAEVASNYSVSLGVEIRSATLQSDLKTVVLNLFRTNDTTAPLIQNLSYTVTIKSIADSATSAIMPGVSQNFIAQDSSAPTIKALTVLGSRAIQVEFSEPIKSSQVRSTSNYELVNDTARVSSIIFDDTGIDSQTSTFVTLFFDRVLTIGDHRIKINFSNGIVDFADYSLTPYDSTFNVASDTTPPTVTQVIAKSRTEVELTFSEGIKNFENLTSNVLWNSYGSTTDGNTPRKIVKLSSNKYLLKFYNAPLGIGNVYIVVKNENVFDYSDNAMTSPSITTVTVSDSIIPTVTSVVVSNTRLIYVFFNTDMQNDGSANSILNKNNITLSYQTGQIVTSNICAGMDYLGHPSSSTTLDYNQNLRRLAINLSADLPLNSYRINMGTVQDFTLKYISPQTYDFSNSETSLPSVISRGYDSTARVVYINFSRTMAISGSNSILDTNNYRLYNSTLPYGTLIATANNNQTIKITFPSGITLSDSTLFRIGYVDSYSITHSVSDSSGNVYPPEESNKTLGTSINSAVNQIDYSSGMASIENYNQVKFISSTFCAAFDPTSLNPNDFILSLDNNVSSTGDNYIPLAITMDSTDSTRRSVILITPNSLQFNSTSTVYLFSPISSSNIQTKDVYGRAILPNSTKFVPLTYNKLSSSYSPTANSSSSTASLTPIASSIEMLRSRASSAYASQIKILNNGITPTSCAQIISSDNLNWDSSLPAGQYSMNIFVQNNPVSINFTINQNSTLTQLMGLIQNNLGTQAYISRDSNKAVIKSAVYGSTSSISVSAGTNGYDLAQQLRLSVNNTSVGTDGDYFTINSQKYIFLPNGSNYQTPSSNVTSVQLGTTVESTATNLVNALNYSSVLTGRAKNSTIELTRNVTTDNTPIPISYTGSNNNFLLTSVPVGGSTMINGDKFIITFSHDMNTNNIKSGWNGSNISVSGLFRIGASAINKINFSNEINIGEIIVPASIPSQSIKTIDGTMEYNSVAKTLTMTFASSDNSSLSLPGILQFTPSSQLMTTSNVQIDSSFKPLTYVGTNEQSAQNLPLFLNDYIGYNW